MRGFVEAEEEKVRSRKRFSSKRKRLMEATKEEAVSLQVQSSFAKFVAEKESSMDKKEASSSEIPLRHLRLESWHHFSVLRTHKISFFFGRECADARSSRETLDNGDEFIDTI